MALQLRRGTNAERLAITPAQGELIFVTDYLAVNITATTIVGSTDTLTFSAAHNLVVGQKLLYQGVTSFGLTTGTIYFVLATGLTTTACKLSLTLNGTAVGLDDATAQTLIFNKAPTLANGTPVGNVSPLWIGNGTTVGGVSAQVSVLDDLLDVTLTSIQEGQTLYYDATTAQWKNTGIFTIDDTTNATNVNITTTDFNLLTRTNSNTDLMSPTMELRTMTTATPLAGYGSAINFSANNTAGAVKQLGSVGVNYTDLGVGAEDANFKVKVMKNGVSPLSPESTFIHQFRVESTGDILTAKNLTLNKDKEFSQSTITFSHPTTDGSITWQGTGHFLSGDLVVQGGSDNQVVIDAPSNTGIANIFNGAIGTTNIGNGSTYLNLGGLTAGTRTHIKSPILDLVGDILVGGNEIKTGNYDSQTGVFSNQQTAILLSGIDVDVKGELKVSGNTIKSSNADAIELSGSNVNTYGNLGVDTGIITTISATGNLFTITPTINIGTATANTTVNIGTNTGNTAINIGGANTLTTIKEDVIVVGDLAVNGDNGGAYADITTTKNQAQLFPANATTVKLAESATTISMGATTGTTTIRNNAVITGDATVNGGNINLNGSATAATQPFITFAQQADGVNSMYGIRGTSTVDDAWFIGSGSTGDDLGYLEIATGDNTGGTNSGGQIYVRQYSGESAGGAPWYGGSGSVVHTLTLLDSIGNTDIPNNLTVGNDIAVNGTGGVWADITTTKNQAQLFPLNALTVNLATASTALTLGATTGSTTVRNNLTVSGDLTVNGTTTTVNSTTLTIDDKNIELGHSPSGATPTDTTASGGGITLKGDTDKTIIWNNATDGWDFNQNISGSGTLALDGAVLTLRANQTGTPNSNNSTTIVVERGDATNAALTFYEADDTWYFTNNAKIESNFNVIGNTILSGTTLASGDVTLGSNTIKASNGTTAITTTSTGDIIVGDDIFGRGNYLQLNYGTTGTPTTGTAGIEIERGDSTNSNLYWDEPTDSWFTSHQLKVLGNLTVNGDGYIYSSTNLALILNGGDVTVAGSLASNGNTTLGSDASDTVTVNGLVNGNITFAFNDTATPKGILGKTVTGADDFWFIGGAKTGADAGYAMIATGDNGTEPIYLRQYNGSPISGTVSKETCLMNASGDTQLYGQLRVGGNYIRSSTDGIALTLNDTSVQVKGNLTVESGSIASTAGVLQLQSTTNNHIKLTPNGTGNVLLEASTVGIGDTSGTLSGNLTTNGAGDLILNTDNSNNSGSITITAGVNGNITIAPNGTGVTNVTGNLQVSGNTIKKSSGTDVITFSGTNLTTFAGDIKLMGDSIYSSTGYRMFDYRETSSIYGTSYQVKMNADRNVGLSTSFVALDNIVEMNTSSLTTTATTTAVLDYFDKTVLRSAKYLIQISNGTSHQMWEGMVIHDGTDIFVTAYGDIRTNGNLATVTVGFNETTGYAELRVTPVNATQTKFKATKTYIAV